MLMKLSSDCMMGSEYKAEVVGTDERSGIAVLRIDAEDLTPASFGNSDSLELGEIVFVNW